MELHHRVCNAWNTIKPVTGERGDRDIDEPVVKLDRRQCELIPGLFWNSLQSAPGDHNHKCDVFACPSEQQHDVLLEDRRHEQLR